MREDAYYAVVDPTDNSPAKRNAAIEEAKRAEKKYLVCRESDCELIDSETTIDAYIGQMLEYDLGVITYGFHKKNRVFSRTNPMAVYHIYGDREEYFSRGVCKGFFIVDLDKLGDLKFEESLKVADFELFLQEAAAKKLIPFNGFYFDIPKSWEAFKEAHDEFSLEDINLRRKNEEEDAKWMKEHDKKIVFETNLDKLSNFLVDHWRNKCQ